MTRPDAPDCPYADKKSYESRALAELAIKRMPRHKRTGLHAYRCRCGRYHLGRRLRRPIAAWRADS